jgi:hypothetical protein
MTNLCRYEYRSLMIVFWFGWYKPLMTWAVHFAEELAGAHSSEVV